MAGIDEVLVLPLERKHMRAIYMLRHSPDVCSQSFGPPPSWEEHHQYVLNCIRDHNCTFLVAECNDSFAGYGKASPLGVVGVAILPMYRKLGIGNMLIKELQAARNYLVANVHIDNKASVALFKRRGFNIRHYDEPWMYLCWRKTDDASTRTSNLDVPVLCTVQRRASLRSGGDEE